MRSWRPSQRRAAIFPHVPAKAGGGLKFFGTPGIASQANLEEMIQPRGGQSTPARTIGSANSGRSNRLCPRAQPGEAHPCCHTRGTHEGPEFVVDRSRHPTTGSIVDHHALAAIDGQRVDCQHGISGSTWGDCCELQSLWVDLGLRGCGLATRLLAAAEAEAAARGCARTVHFTYDFQAIEFYSKCGYEVIGCVEEFPSGTDA